MRNGNVLVVAALATLLVANTGPAQQRQAVSRRGHGTSRLDDRIDNIISDQSYRIISQDTLIARTDTLRGPVLIIGNRFVLEGTIVGNVAIVDANVYVRPTARIEGQVTNIGGGFYRSEQAFLTGLVDHPLAPYHVEREGDALIIVGDVETKAFKLNPKPPSANRVEGIRPALGATFTVNPRSRNLLEVHGWGAYGIELDPWQEALQGGAELRFHRGLTHVSVGIEETTATNDAWNRSDIKNSISFLWNGKDYRDYYEAERQFVMVARELIRGGHEAVVSLRGQREDAESLLEGDPWVLLEPKGGSLRVNPAISPGVTSSGILNLRGKWTALTTAAEYDGSIEVARDNVADGQFAFNAYFVTAKWAMQALANHTLEIETRVQGPIGTDSLPRQRWGILGGSGTLYTFDVAEFRGDRLVFVETEYSIPMPSRIRLPYLGSPALQFLHGVGKAWTQGADNKFEQNIGARLQFPFFYVRVMTNPSRTSDTKFSANVSFPKSAYPWEKRTQDAARSR
jgi:hypothetical protein